MPINFHIALHLPLFGFRSGDMPHLSNAMDIVHNSHDLAADPSPHCHIGARLLAWSMRNQQKHIVESTLYGNVILILVLASNFWSSLAQDVVDQQSQDGGSDFLPGIPGPGSNRDEAIAARVMFNDLEPTCEELRAMWRYVVA